MPGREEGVEVLAITDRHVLQHDHVARERTARSDSAAGRRDGIVIVPPAVVGVPGDRGWSETVNAIDPAVVLAVASVSDFVASFALKRIGDAGVTLGARQTGSHCCERDIVRTLQRAVARDLERVVRPATAPLCGTENVKAPVESDRRRSPLRSCCRKGRRR